MTVTFGQMADEGLWEDFCEITGINPWCMNEGRVSEEEEYDLSPEQICRLFGCGSRKKPS